MKTLKRLALTAALVALGACYPMLPPEGAVVVRTAPPPYREEVIGVAPGPDYFWIAGYWEWGGAAYSWVPGRWAARPYPHAVWERGSWRGTRRGWFWAPGHWRGRHEHERDEE